VLTSTPRPGAELALDPVVPEGTVRARYVALASSVAADVKPLPEKSWSRNEERGDAHCDVCICPLQGTI